MTPPGDILSRRHEQNLFAMLIVQRTRSSPNHHERTKPKELIDHPPGHEIERLNREIEEQYGDVEWTPASVIAIVLIAVPFVAFGIHILLTAGVLQKIAAIFGVVFGLWILFLKAIAWVSVTEAQSR
jgi:hypothetical protein